MNITPTESDKTLANPPIKWVGGKRKLLPTIVPLLPKSYNVYYEPFLGGGALYFHLQPTVAYISDINSELINTYQTIKSRVSLLIEELKNYENNEEYFNKTRELDRDPKTFSKLSSVQRAARFIYLNKTCFNGLYRVNSKGQFNVPFGGYSSPNILDVDNLLACSKVLQTTNINCENFTSVVEYAQKDDFVYFDPPYIPDGISSTFTQYTKDGFGMAEQQELVDVCNLLDSKGVKWMLSNSSAPIIWKMYSKFNIEIVEVQRNIAASANSRKKVNEVIVRNYG